jgi:hypothetical protein
MTARACFHSSILNSIMIEIETQFNINKTNFDFKQVST